MPRSHTTAALTDGAHTFEVRAPDAADDTDASPASRTATVDAGAPQTTISEAPPATTSSTSATFIFTSSEQGPSFEFSADETAGFECRLAEGDWIACTSSQDRTGFAQPLDARARVYARAVPETARGAGWGNAGAVASTRTGAEDGATALRPISATRATGRGVAPALFRIG